MRIYVASSWRNADQPRIVELLRDAGYEVYDFKNPAPGDNGFHWTEIGINWKTWTKYQYRKALNHEIAIEGFSYDYEAMKWADVFVGVQPFGVSASIEMGWAAGHPEKRTVLLMARGEPELMVKVFDYLCCDDSEMLGILKFLENDLRAGMYDDSKVEEEDA